jgi:hypothetical protein
MARSEVFEPPTLWFVEIYSRALQVGREADDSVVTGDIVQGRVGGK